MLGRDHAGKRAFTLIELLVVIAIIALLIGILLPALGSARVAAQATVSVSNLRQFGVSTLNYASDHKDEWLNPYDPNETVSLYRSGNIRVPHIPGSYWNMTGPVAQRRSEPFAMHAGSLLMHYMADGPSGLTSKIQFAPGDANVLERFRRIAIDGGEYDNYIWDTSYFYSPTMYFDSSRYETDSLQSPVLPRDWKRNRVDDALWPSQKVVWFERFDFSKPIRSQASGARVRQFPNWNNPIATPNVMVADGSARAVSIADVISQTQSTNPAVARIYTPSGLWDPPTSWLRYYDMANDGFENGDGDTRAYPSFFWATRDGIRGQDVYR